MAATLEVAAAETARASEKVASNYKLALRLGSPEEFQISWPMGCPNDLAAEGAEHNVHSEASVYSTTAAADEPQREEEEEEPQFVRCTVAESQCGNNVISADESTAAWTHESTLHLIGVCERRKHLFHVAGVKKMDVWKQVADEMQQSFGLRTYSWEGCEKKMRNLKYRYKLLTMKNSGNNKCCNGRRPWVYYDAIDSIVTSDPNVIHKNQIKDSITHGSESEFQVSWQDGALEDGVVLECRGGDEEDEEDEDEEESACEHEQPLKRSKGSHSSIKMAATESFQGNNMDELSMPTEVAIANEAVGWTHELTLMLIGACKERQHLFSAPGIKKMDVWKQVADAMQQQQQQDAVGGRTTIFSWEACEKKMRNLKYRYKLIVNGNDEKKTKKSKSRKQWEYFDAIDRLMTHDSVVAEKHRQNFSVHRQNTTDAVQLKAGVKRKGEFCKFFLTQQVPTKSVLLTRTTKPATNLRRQKKSLSSSSSSDCHSTESPPPPWFREFAREQRQCLEDIIKVNKEALKVAKERNNILQVLTEAFLKRESLVERKLS